MNERIQQLAEQAHRSTRDELVHLERVHNRIYDLNESTVIYNEKFAELIVGHAIECVRDVLRDENSDLTYTAASQVQNRIKQFFGVEE